MVGIIVGQIGAGHSIDQLLADYPYLEHEDIVQALRFAAWLTEEPEVTLPGMKLLVDTYSWNGTS